MKLLPHDEGDQDWVRFYGIGGESYEIKTENLGIRCDTVVTLYGEDGTSPFVTRDDGVLGQGELLSWQCPADGLYYIMVKQYEYDPAIFGPETGYDLKVYHPTAAGVGKLLGRVVDAAGKGIDGAVVKSDIVGASAITLPNGYYLMILPTGTYTISAMAGGFDPKAQGGVTVTELNAVTLDFGMSPMAEMSMGNLNGDGTVDLADLIVALQCIAGLNVSGSIRPDYTTSGADVDGDSKVGLEEAISIMQRVSGLR